MAVQCEWRRNLRCTRDIGRTSALARARLLGEIRLGHSIAPAPALHAQFGAIAEGRSDHATDGRELLDPDLSRALLDRRDVADAEHRHLRPDVTDAIQRACEATIFTFGTRVERLDDVAPAGHAASHRDDLVKTQRLCEAMRIRMERTGLPVHREHESRDPCDLSNHCRFEPRDRELRDRRIVEHRVRDSRNDIDAARGGLSEHVDERYCPFAANELDEWLQDFFLMHELEAIDPT
jgi:hypothetical protein